MSSYSYLPAQQQSLQRVVNLFNSDEAFWRKLAGRRKRRRELLLQLSSRNHEALDLVEFARRRPPDDCVGSPADPGSGT